MMNLLFKQPVLSLNDPAAVYESKKNVVLVASTLGLTNYPTCAVDKAYENLSAVLVRDLFRLYIHIMYTCLMQSSVI